MKIIKHTLIAALVLFSAIYWNVVNAHQYDVVVKGQRAGEAELRIKQDKAAYKIELLLYPNMLAKVFGIDDMVDVSTGHFQSGHYYPAHYERKETDGKQLLSVDFKDNAVNALGKKGRKVFDVEVKAQDPLTQILQIQYDLKHNQLASFYDLVTDTSQTRYFAERQNNQVTLKQNNQNERIIHLWFDENYRLTRMKKNKRGKVQFDMRKKDNNN